MKQSKWFWIDSALSILGSVISIAGIFTSIKASSDISRQNYLDLEQRYGLTPVNEDESD